MTLECIYITRHGFRSNWVVNPTTGDYTAFVRSPTGIPADPALTSHGVNQARELAAHLTRAPLDAGLGDGRRGRPLPVERIYCSPYYRCLQTVQPFVETVGDADGGAARSEGEAVPWWAVRCDPGLVDWFGPAPFEQPQPAPLPLLRDKFFPWISADYQASGIVPPRNGESMAQLHARMAATLAHIIRQCDADGVRAILLCSHAAPIIAMGRALTGNLPFDVAAEDFGAFTCGLSVFRRRRLSSALACGDDLRQQQRQQQQQQRQTQESSSLPSHVPPWDDQFHTLAGQAWIGGRGVGGGWDCEENCDCSFLSEGEERGWRFSGDDESFAGVELQSGPIVDAGLALGVVVEGRSAGRTLAKSRPLQGAGGSSSSSAGVGGGKGDGDGYGGKPSSRL